MTDKSIFEQEIDKILEKSDDLPTGSNSSDRPTFEPFSPTVPKRPGRERLSNVALNPSYLIIAGLALLAAAAFTSFARVPVALVGIGLLAIGYYLSLKRGLFAQSGFWGGRSIFSRCKSLEPTSIDEPQVKYWRGRRIEPKPDRPVNQPRQDKGKIIEFTQHDDQDK
tara:strand:+ start:17766 stop:18266 length:501 start_codon:yes stop_codon:yes gene_type:complete